MQCNFRLQALRRFLPLICGLTLVSPGFAGPPAFSFDRALQIYNDVTTASQLTEYLKEASADDQKDFRYTLYRIRGCYANYQFEDGDALVEVGLLGARNAGLTNTQVDGIRSNLKNEKDYWESLFRLSQKGHAGSGGDSETSVWQWSWSSPSPNPTSGKALSQGHTGSGGNSHAHSYRPTE
jgi:hypothetical protein